jgi:hypothetical protein
VVSRNKTRRFGPWLNLKGAQIVTGTQQASVALHYRELIDDMRKAIATKDAA